MTEAQAQWIAEYHRQVPDLSGKCHAACKAMLLDFPCLKLVRGHVSVIGDTDPLGQPHWWLVDLATREVIDPTAGQFGVILAYEEHDESEPEPTGKCPNCGGYCHGGRSVCSDRCHQEYAAYLQDAVRSV